MGMFWTAVGPHYVDYADRGGEATVNIDGQLYDEDYDDVALDRATSEEFDDADEEMEDFFDIN
jgi:hypothetical protein